MEEPQNPVNEIIKKRLESTTALVDDWHKLREYIAPFIEANKDMQQLVSKINLGLIMVPMEDLILMTAVTAERMSLDILKPKHMFCLKCLAELKNEQ